MSETRNVSERVTESVCVIEIERERDGAEGEREGGKPERMREGGKRYIGGQREGVGRDMGDREIERGRVRERDGDRDRQIYLNSESYQFLQSFHKSRIIYT